MLKRRNKIEFTRETFLGAYLCFLLIMSTLQLIECWAARVNVIIHATQRYEHYYYATQNHVRSTI